MAVLNCFVAVLERCFEPTGERFWDCFLAVLRYFVFFETVLGRLWGCFGAVLGCLGAGLRLLWGCFRAVLKLFGLFWSCFEALLERFWPVLGFLGPVLRLFGAVLGGGFGSGLELFWTVVLRLCWAVLRLPGAVVRRFWGCFGDVLGPF